MDQALEIWATEADCSEISLDGVSDFARVWVFSAISSVGLLIMLIVPFVWCRKRAARVVPEGIVDESPTGATKTRASEVEADLNRSEPDLAAAKRHLVRSSATVDGKWLSPCSAGLDKMCVIGGTGTSLYFGTLRSMGYLFATMAAITFPTTAFCLLGTFAPDNGQFLARTTIGNLGLYVDTQVLDPLLRIVRVNCDGASLSNLTAAFAWLDFAAVFILFVYLVRFRRSKTTTCSRSRSPISRCSSKSCQPGSRTNATTNVFSRNTWRVACGQCRMPMGTRKIRRSAKSRWFGTSRAGWMPYKNRLASPNRSKCRKPTTTRGNLPS